MMAKSIGSVVDVTAGRITVGYAILHALTGEDTIYGRATVVDHPINAYQLKIQPSDNDAVQVTVVDLAAGIVGANQRAEGTDYPDDGQRSAARRHADQVIRWARRLKPGSVLKVT